MSRLLLLAALLAAASASPGQETTRRVGNVTITVDQSLAFPGGVMVARLSSRRTLGTVYAILDGRRSPAFPSPAGLRALVPIPADATPGPDTLGVEIFGRRGRQRIPLGVTVKTREGSPPSLAIPVERQLLLKLPNTVRDGRRLLTALRTVTPYAQWYGPFQAPVEAPARSTFGVRPASAAPPVEAVMDGIYGEYHRGLDYDVPVGTVVQAPAAGTVVFADNLTLSGWTVVIDHGQGILSALYHLSRVDVRVGDRVEGRAPLGLSGETGYVSGPVLHWGTYVMGVAVDPAILLQVTG